MNHALICKSYYKDNKNAIDFCNQELIKFELYFNALHAKDWYYNAMKYHAIHIIKELLVQDRITECKSLLQKYNLSDAILTYVIKIDKIIDTIPFDIIEKKLKYISNENMIIKEKKRKNKKLL